MGQVYIESPKYVILYILKVFIKYMGILNILKNIFEKINGKK